jgi:hypothetical protein
LGERIVLRRAFFGIENGVNGWVVDFLVVFGKKMDETVEGYAGHYVNEETDGLLARYISCG